MEETNRVSAALLFPDPTLASTPPVSVTPALTLADVAAIDPAVHKALVEWDKLHQKVLAASAPAPQPASPTSPGSTLTTTHTLESLVALLSKDALKDRVKFAKYLAKLVPVLVGSPAALNAVVAGPLLSPHWKTVGETLLVCAARRVEAAFVKDTKNWAVLLVAELFKFGPKPGLRHLLFAVILVELEEKEGLHLLGLPPPRLLDAKVDLESLVHAEVQGFLAVRPAPLAQSFAGSVATKSKPPPQRTAALRGVLTDSRLALYLMLAGNELQCGSEVFLLLDQVAKYTALAILVATCKKWREAIVKGTSNVKLSIDVCVVLVLRQLFSSTALQMLTGHESLLLKTVFCLTLRDNSWFWDKIEAVGLDYREGLSLSPEELHLLLTLNAKLVRKLGKVCFGKTNEYKSTKLKIVQHLERSLADTFVRSVRDCQADKFRAVCGETLEELASSVELASLFVQPATATAIGSAVCGVARTVVEGGDHTQQTVADTATLVSLACGREEVVREMRVVGRLFFGLLQTGLDDRQGLSQQMVRSSLQTLKAFYRVFSRVVLGGAVLYPMVLTLVVRLAQHSADKRDIADSDALHLLRVSRLVLEHSKLQPEWPLALSSWNPSHRTLAALADAYTPLIVRAACQFLRLDSPSSVSTPARPSDAVALEVCLLLRSVGNPLLVDSFRSKVAESVQHTHLANLLYLHQLARPSASGIQPFFEETVVLECFGVDTLAHFLQSARQTHQDTAVDSTANTEPKYSVLPESLTHLEDRRLLDLYRTSQLPPKPLSSPSPSTATTTTTADLFLSDGTNILQVDADRSLLRLRSDKGAFDYRLQADPHSLANFLSANGWLSPEVVALRDKNQRDLAALLAMVDDRDSLVPVRVGLFVLPSRARFLDCPATNEDLERLVVRHSQEPLPADLRQIVAGMVDSHPDRLAYRNTLVTNHVVRASLMVAALYQEQKDRAFELKKELGTCEVNVYLDPDGVAPSIGDQFVKSGQTFVEVVASRLSADHWSVALKPHPTLADELQRQRSRAHEAWHSRSDGDAFGLVDFSDFWLSGLSQQRSAPRLTVHVADLPTVLRSLSVWYSLAAKATSGSLRSAALHRRTKLSEICSKYGGGDKTGDVLELLHGLLTANN